MLAGIIGLGLVGGSLGLALKETKMFKRVLGLDSRSLHEKQALSLGLVDECVSIDVIEDCDVIFIAIPLDDVSGVANSFQNLSKTQVIIDLGSAKSLINSEIAPAIRKNYVGAHPMSGTEHSGPKAAIKDLFKNKILVLTDVGLCGEFQVAFAKEIFVSLGMQIIIMDSTSHDKHTAYISHLPHILSFALANTVLLQEAPEHVLALIGGGFRSMARISNSSPVTWRDIFKHNKAFLLESMCNFEINFSYAKNLIEQEKWEELEAWMKKANGLHEFL